MEDLKEQVKEQNKKTKSAIVKDKALIEKPKNLVSAVLQVMNEVKGIEKNLTVGKGNFSYKGVSDSDVKRILGDAMFKAGLIILPIEVNPEMKIERWTEATNYNGVIGEKTKQQIFVEVKTKYKLIHESGESEIIEGYGHGIDSMDKASGKATTYALKYALLYSFLVPTGEIHDTDKESSDNIEVPKKTPKKKPETPKTPKAEEPVLKEKLSEDRFTKACNVIDEGKYSIKKLKEDYDLSEEQLKELDAWAESKKTPTK